MQGATPSLVGIDALVDRLVADAGLPIGFEVAGDLFRAPGFGQLGFHDGPSLGSHTGAVLTDPHAGL